MIATPQTSDEFEAATLGFQWQWNANHDDAWLSLNARPHWLRLYPRFAEPDRVNRLPNLLLQKFPARAFTGETSLEFAPIQEGEEAGLVVVGESFANLGLVKSEAGLRLVLRVNGEQTFAADHLPGTMKLRVAVKDGGLCEFSFARQDDFVAIAQTFMARKGKWIGAKLGLYSLKRRDSAPASHVDFDYFRFA